MATEEEVRDALRSVMDPELGVNVVDLGLVYDVDVDGDQARIRMTLTSPGCPVGSSLAEGVRSGALKAPGINDAQVELVFDPPWSPDLMSDAARSQLGGT